MFSKNAFFYAFKNSVFRQWRTGLISCFLFAVLSFIAKASILGVVFSTTFVMIFAIVVIWGMYEFEATTDLQKKALLDNWAKEVSDEKEKNKRLALVQNSPMEAWGAANLSEPSGPLMNVDGTPMAPGYSKVDVNGDLFGMPSHAVPVFNPDTGTWTDPSNGYSPEYSPPDISRD